MISWIVRHARVAIAILIVGALVEAAAGGATWFLARRGAMAYIPSFSAAGIADYLRQRDTALGWGTSRDAAGRREIAARPDPAFPAAARPCVSAYGDSYTAGSGVSDAATFPHDLALELGCPVANFGVGGYGSDQALMLARSAHVDDAAITILGHMSENVLRNVNQYRNLLISNTEFAFKPRYVLDGDRLRYVPIPVTSPRDFSLLAADPKRALPDDAFVDRPRRSFPYAVSLARYLVLDPHVRATVLRVPWYVPYYRPDHPSHALPLTTEILASFVQDAWRRHRAGLIVLIPNAADLAYVKRTGVWPDQPLADALGARGIPVVHLGPQLRSRIKNDDPCTLFLHCDGHLTEVGNRMVAQILRAAIGSLVNYSSPSTSR